MVPHCCFAIVSLLVPLAFVTCQIMTLLVLDGAWRIWGLLPLPVAALSLALLLTKDSVGPFFAVILSATGGLAALALVWAAFGRAARKRDATGST